MASESKDIFCNEEELTETSYNISQEVDNGGKCTARLAQLCNNPKFSDVALLVAGRRFFAHRLLLANASDVFEQMLTSDNWKESGRTELVLKEAEDCVPVFADFLSYMYSGQVKLTSETVLGLLVLADKYNVQDLKECCAEFMSSHLVSLSDSNKAITWYQYAIACNSQELEQACFNYIILNMDTVIQSPDWVYLDKENLIIMLERSDLVIESEYMLLQAVVRWLQEDGRVTFLEENLLNILPFIRFPMILPEHLSEFEESIFEQEYHQHFAPYLLSAYRYHALSIKNIKRHHSIDVPISQFTYRNYTDENYSVHVDVIRMAFKSCPRVSSKVEKPLNLPLTISNTAQDKQCKMKVTFYPHGYYTTSLWNGQLSLAKSSDLSKLIISHRGGTEIQKAEISVIIYAKQHGIKFAKFAITHRHVYETYGTFEIDNVVDVERLKKEDSSFIIEGALYLKVFVRPISFNKGITESP